MAKRDEVYILTQRIVTACIEISRTGKLAPNLTPRQEVIVQLVHQKIRDCHEFLESSCADLSLTSTNFNTMVVQVWEGMFEDGIVNWGRVVSFLAFCSYVCLYSQRKGLPASVSESIPHWAAAFVTGGILRDWIVARGGWDAFKLVAVPKNSGGSTYSNNSSPSNSDDEENVGGGWLEQSFKGLALGLNIYNSLRVR